MKMSMESSLCLVRVEIFRAVRSLLHLHRKNDGKSASFHGRGRTGRIGRAFQRNARQYIPPDRRHAQFAGQRGPRSSHAHDPSAKRRGNRLADRRRRRSARQALEKCAEKSERILVMLETLMDISEAEIGVMNIDRQIVDISALLENVCTEEKKTVRKKASASAWSKARSLPSPFRLCRRDGARRPLPIFRVPSPLITP